MLTGIGHIFLIYFFYGKVRNRQCVHLVMTEWSGERNVLSQNQ